MNRRDLETLLITLESTPALLARAAGEVSAREAARRPAVGAFSLLEHVWHLADLEREAYTSRIRRLLTEEEPALSNFDGDRLARERRYQSRNLAEGLAAFSAARRRNVERLRAVPASAWKRAGFQESIGQITLADVPRLMAEHDRAHSDEIRGLLAYLRTGKDLESPRQTSAVA